MSGLPVDAAFGLVLGPRASRGSRVPRGRRTVLQTMSRSVGALLSPLNPGFLSSISTRNLSANNLLTIASLQALKVPHTVLDRQVFTSPEYS